MKQLKIIKYLCLLLFLNNGCLLKDDSINEFRKFPIEYDLHSKPILSLASPGAFLELYDSLLFVCNTYDKEYFIRIYNKNNFEFYKYFLQRGKGPNEMSLFGRIAIDLKNNSLWISDYPHNDIWGYSIDSILLYNKNTPSAIIHFPSKVYPIIEFHCYDSLFYLPDLRGGAGFLIYNSTGKEIGHIGNFNIGETRKIIGTDLNYTLSNIFPKRNKIVTVYRYLDKLIIHELKGEKFKIVIGPDRLNIDKQIKGNDLTRIEAYFPYYPRSFHNYIFAVYNGKPGMIVNQVTGSLEATSGNNIHVFDWTGKPVARFNLDHQIISFVIDSLNNRIIAFASEADTSIVEYNIKDVLQALEKKYVQ